MRRLTLVPPLTLAVLLSVPAVARAGDPAAAQALYDEAKQLMSDGRYHDACPKLEESEHLDPGMGTEFRLADCWQHVGRTASAWALFRQVESEAHATGQGGRERVARDRAEALGGFLSHLVVDVSASSAPAGLTITRDGEEISHAMWGVPVPVDPGAHVVSARAPGKQPWEATVQVEPDGKSVDVQVPSLADVPAPAPVASAMEPAPVPAPTPVAPPRSFAPPPTPTPAPAPRPAVTEAMPPSPETPVVQNAGGFQRALGWIFVGAGFVGLGTGGYFGVKYLQQAGSTPGVAPSTDAAADRDRAEASLGAGAAALFLGTILVTTAPGPHLVTRHDARLDVTPVVGGRSGGLVLRGAW